MNDRAASAEELSREDRMVNHLRFKALECLSKHVSATDFEGRYKFLVGYFEGALLSHEYTSVVFRTKQRLFEELGIR